MKLAWDYLWNHRYDSLRVRLRQVFLVWPHQWMMKRLGSKEELYRQLTWQLMDYARDYDRCGTFPYWVGSRAPHDWRHALLEMLRDQDEPMYRLALRIERREFPNR